MSLHLHPPFRADHIGSLKRPSKLLEKRKEFDNGECTRDELTKLEDEAIKAVVQMQREVGIKAITDGEFRRCGFYHSPRLQRGRIADAPFAQAHVLRWGV